MGVNMNTQAYHLDGEGCGDLAYHQRHDMLVEIDFKWLMAGQGCHIDPERLKHDASYAQGCLQFALDSRCDPLRSCALCLRAELEQMRASTPYPPGFEAWNCG